MFEYLKERLLRKRITKLLKHSDTYYVSFMKHQNESEIKKFEDPIDFTTIVGNNFFKGMVMFNETLDKAFIIYSEEEGIKVIEKTFEELDYLYRWWLWKSAGSIDLAEISLG